MTPRTRAAVPSQDDVVVWRIRLDAVSVEGPSELSPDELARAARFQFVEARDAFVRGRLFLRRMLGRTLDRDPCSLEFATEGNGKPKLVGDPLAFNLSHSGGEAALAISGTAPVGVDIEQVNAERDLLGLARRYFSTREYDELSRLPPPEQVAAFYRCWSRKEAFIKALGQGLSHALDSFTVSLAPYAPAALLSLGPGLGSPRDWRVFNLELGTHLAGAVVVPASVVRLHCYTLESI